MSSKTQFFEKPSNPQPFTEPKNMTTIELNKSGYQVEDGQNLSEKESIKKFKVTKKTLLLSMGLSIILGICVSILILLIHKGNTNGFYRNKNISQTEISSLKILFKDREKVQACKTSKSLEDCCYIFFKRNVHEEVGKCTVQKILKLFLQYELEANQRSKRQNYNNFDVNYQEDYNWERLHDFNEQLVNNYQQYGDNYFDYYSDQGAENDEPDVNYYNEENVLNYKTEPDVNYYNEENVLSYKTKPKVSYYDEEKKLSYDTEYYQVNQRNSQNRDQMPSGPQEIFPPGEIRTTPNIRNEGIIVESTPSPQLFSSTTLPKKCLDRSCSDIKNVSAKIDYITNIHAEPGKLKITLNNTKINLKHELRTNERISQGNDFDMKPTVGMQSSNKQANPCFYPISAPYVSSYPHFDPNSFFGVMPVNQNVQRQPLYIINPPVYPTIPMPMQTYSNYQNSPIMNKDAIQVAGTGGQFYVCKPTNNAPGLQGVEVRRMSQAFTLQDLVQAAPIVQKSNQPREALECPFGTRACTDGSKCIHNRQVCDNEVNCDDASDETTCSCKHRVGEFRWCDGYPDCPNNEDEINCFDCGTDEFSCDDWSKLQRGTCILLTQRCDGIKHCEITGKDEEDCAILTDHLGQHSDSKISNAVGFLHRNYKGRWYPTCFGAEIFSSDVCKTEAGPNEIAPKTHLVASNDNYPGPFLDVSPSEGIVLADTCMTNKAAFVECPPIYCGLRLTINNPFRNSEIDTSVEEFLTRRQRIKKEIGDSRVVGGKPSQPTSWPWVVAIYKNGVFHCGGVLITDLWILTAAHCVDKFWFFYYEIQAGILRRFSYSPMEQTRWATMAIPHEEYNKKSLKNDIALMKLSKPVRFNRYVRPICLPSQLTAGEDFLRGPKPNTVCVTVGWGATVEHGSDPDHLREVEIPISPQCKHAEDKEGDEICAGLLEGGRDACQGDSGGPLMCQSIKNRSQWYLAGIVSHGEGCARPNEPGVYTKVSKYLGWVHDNINGKTSGRFPLQKCPGYVCVGTGKCLSKKRHCDKIVDCLFGDDEINCWQSPEESSHLEIVGSPRGFLDRWLHIFDLDDSSEENNVEASTSSDTFQTESTEIDISTKKFTCRNMFQTIPFNEKCNKVVNCEDGTDESECSCVDYLRRVDKKAICDGVTDCRDLSDEANCTKCSPVHHLCRISQKCIPLEKRCDRKVDCINGEDEWDCVALTDGETLILDSDLRPKQSMKGIITINRFGVWRPLCTNASIDSAASIATNVCDLLGFEEYTAFHKLSVEDKSLNATIDGFDRYRSSLNELPFCGGLFVRCLNVSLGDNIRKVYRDNVTSQVELFTSPWNAVIYLDGKPKCTGAILSGHCIIVASTCFAETFLKNTYVAALLGKGKAHLDVEGPHEQIVLMKTVAIVNNSETTVLCTEQKISFNRYIQPVKLPEKSNEPNKEKCVAIVIQEAKTKVVVLKDRKQCKPGFRCFKTEESCKQNKISHPWNGIITCNSRNGWYAAVAYTTINDSCEFSKRELPTIDKYRVEMAIGNDLSEIPPRQCEGFRCTLGECLKKSKVCDGIPDCRNGEDEDSSLCSKLKEECHLSRNCTNFPYCPLSEYKCRNGPCTPKTSFCDTINDCGDLYDEPPECSCRTYLETVHPEKICDGKVNCWDRSDENPEKCVCRYPTNVTCGQTELCISQEMVCDGFKDCPNGEDESRCYTLKTNLASTNSGEVMKRTAGIWHSGCFSRNYTRSELEKICERLGFAGGSAKQLIPSKDTNNITSNPVKDRFDIVWIRRGAGSGFKLRFRTGNEPYVKFVEDPNCYKLFIECL